MATEATRTAEFLKALRARVGPLADVTKYNDRSTSGTPDASLTAYGRTVWMEFKHRKTDMILPELLAQTNRRSKLQIHRLWRLHYASHGRAFLVVFEKDRSVSLVAVLTHGVPTFRVTATGTVSEVIAHLLALCH